MLVTIILTCYKQEKFIEETILSVVNQKYQNRELLIGDDSPDDNCRNIISKYTKKYPEKIHAWHHNPNKGIVNNMQFLLDQRNKESEYVAFLEGDDCLFPEYLEKKLEIFGKYPNVQLVYNELMTIDEEGKIITKNKLKHSNNCICKKGKISYNNLLNKNYYMSWSTLMVRSGTLHKYHIYDDFLGLRTIISDVYFFNQIAHNEDIYGIEEPLLYYRIHKDSVSKNILGTVSFCFDFINYINYLFEEGFISKNTKKNEICRRYMIISIESLKKALDFGIIRSFNIFIYECIKTIIIRCKWLIK